MKSPAFQSFSLMPASLRACSIKKAAINAALLKKSIL
jgi:hypothetical protein